MPQDIFKPDLETRLWFGCEKHSSRTESTPWRLSAFESIGADDAVMPFEEVVKSRQHRQIGD